MSSSDSEKPQPQPQQCTSSENCSTTTSNNSQALAHRLKISLQQELIASDALISIFVSAMRENKTCCVDALEIMELINTTPSLYTVLKSLKANDYALMTSLNDSIIEWLHWLIVDGLTLRMLNSDEYVRLMSTLDRVERIKRRPLHIFEIKNAPLKCTNAQRRSSNAEIRYEFYVGHLSWFYTIVKNGFTMYSCKRNDFIGKRLRLLPDLESAIDCLQFDSSWCGSICGTEIGCIALCSYVLEPERVRIECNVRVNSTLIEDSDLVTPRFLLYYGNRGAPPKVTYERLQSSKSGLLQFTPSALRMLVSKKKIHENLAASAVAALGHLVLPLCNQILS